MTSPKDICSGARCNILIGHASALCRLTLMLTLPELSRGQLGAEDQLETHKHLRTQIGTWTPWPWRTSQHGPRCRGSSRC